MVPTIGSSVTDLPPLGGALGQTLGLRPALVAGGLLDALSFLWVVRSPLCRAALPSEPVPAA